MEYSTIYSSHDQGEISIITRLFDEEYIDFKILEEAITTPDENANVGNTGIRIQVPIDQYEKAKTVLLENGFLGNWKKGRSKRRQIASMPKWIFIFLAALVLIIVAFLIMWFMNP